MAVTTTLTDGKLSVQSPYHPDFPKRARKLGGKWDGGSKRWSFDARDEPRVRELCREIYGEDGSADAETCTIRVRYPTQGWADKGALYVAGRQVARAFGRDSGARLGEGVVLFEGDIGSGGSRNNWATVCDKGTVFEVRDVPVPAAEAALCDADVDDLEITILRDGEVDREALRAEGLRLLARLREIEAALGEAIADEVAS